MPRQGPRLAMPSCFWLLPLQLCLLEETFCLSGAVPACCATSTSLLLGPQKEGNFSSKQETPPAGRNPADFPQVETREGVELLCTGAATWVHAGVVEGCPAACSPGAALQDGDSSAEKGAAIPKTCCAKSRPDWQMMGVKSQSPVYAPDA